MVCMVFVGATWRDDCFAATSQICAHQRSALSFILFLIFIIFFFCLSLISPSPLLPPTLILYSLAGWVRVRSPRLWGLGKTIPPIVDTFNRAFCQGQGADGNTIFSSGSDAFVPFIFSFSPISPGAVPLCQLNFGSFSPLLAPGGARARLAGVNPPRVRCWRWSVSFLGLHPLFLARQTGYLLERHGRRLLSPTTIYPTVGPCTVDILCSR